MALRSVSEFSGSASARLFVQTMHQIHTLYSYNNIIETSLKIIMASSLMYNGQIILLQGDCSVERFNCTLERMNFMGPELFTLKYSVLGTLSGILWYFPLFGVRKSPYPPSTKGFWFEPPPPPPSPWNFQLRPPLSEIPMIFLNYVGYWYFLEPHIIYHHWYTVPLADQPWFK